ncbi:hypothetical protein, partial [Acidithiobacillus ferriphilus]|uniref:hypothetical protein n=1 Tax=Acidithiobacillus ferriphilus TaxID=1689834 RepID=UPI001D0058CA
MRMPARAIALAARWPAYPGRKVGALLLAEGSHAALDGFSYSSQSLVRASWMGVPPPLVSH